MNSRYTYMKESNQIDIDGETWPDPLSVNFAEFRLSSMPSVHTVTAGDISKFITYYYNIYGITEFDDVLLSLNGIPYIGTLEPGDEIVEISPNDMISALSSN